MIRTEFKVDSGVCFCCFSSIFKQEGGWHFHSLKWRHFPFNMLYILEQFQIHSKVDRKEQRILLCALPQNMHSLPRYQHYLTRMGTLVTIDEPVLVLKLTKLWFEFRWTLSIVVLQILPNKVTFIHHYRIRQNTFTAPQILCILPSHPSHFPKPWQPLIVLLSP